MLTFLISCLIMLIFSDFAETSEIEGLRLYRSPDRTRIVLDLNEPVRYQTFTLENPNRVVVDIRDSRLNAEFEQLDLSNTPITRIRTGVRDNTSLRMVFDLANQVSSKVFSLQSNERYGNRLVVDLYDIKKRTSKRLAGIIEQVNRKIIIAIDAGHGGEDPGALGPGRIREKVIVLQIAKRLKNLFDDDSDFRGVLIRKGDYYLAHRRRTEIAHSSLADFFISIHADAFSSPAAYGASVYALSTKGATSEAARYLASKENRADLIGGAVSLSLGDKPDALAEVLLDLSMTATLSSSLAAGEYVLKNIDGLARLHKKRVEQAGFLVLKSPDIPSLLIEAGFISNPREAKLLSSATYQQKMARAIYSGMVQYYLDNPPPGTSLAFNKTERLKTHIVLKGDTLSQIAQKYRTSVDNLLRYNKLSSKQIKVGQRISLPPSK
jgi:N-acetylmuramoyl-L-alanine amidase